jgi:hypothetical protein
MRISFAARAALVALGLFACLVLAPLRGWAQPATAPAEPVAPVNPEAERKEKARAHFLKGLELVQAEDWNAALAEFLTSRELFPTQVALKNAAITFRQLKRNAEAMEMYRELLASFGPKLSADDKAAAERALADLAKNVAEVGVRSAEPGASVCVSGRCRTVPFDKPLTVDPGTHVLRAQKAGFLPFETEVVLAGGDKKTVKVELSRLAESGTLRVEEATGRVLDVVVDGAVMGKTPWSGQLGVGTHTVLLTGADDFGTPPSPAEVRANQVTALRLTARRLDAAFRVEPTPANAKVFVDGIPLGNGVWEGKLESGKHQIEVAAEGFIALRREIVLRSGQREVLHAVLERDLENPMWAGVAFRPHLYAELLGGPAFATSFGGGADAACGRGECGDRSRPFGFLVGARGGYTFARGLGVEVFLGWLSMRESMTRSVNASADYDVTADDYADATRFSGPAAAISASYQFLETTPITARVWLGMARVKARYENDGTYRGTAVQGSSGETVDFAVPASIPEASQNLWLPFAGPEVRFGYRVSKTLLLDGGLAVLFAFPASSRRTGTSERDRSRSERSQGLPSVPNAFSDGSSAPLGLLRLPGEDGFATFVMFVPTIAARMDF